MSDFTFGLVGWGTCALSGYLLLMLLVTNSNKQPYLTQLTSRNTTAIRWTFAASPIIISLIAVSVALIATPGLANPEREIVPSVFGYLAATGLFFALPSAITALLGYFYFMPKSRKGFRNHLHFAFNASGIAVVGGLIYVVGLALLLAIPSGTAGTSMFVLVIMFGGIAAIVLGPIIGFIGGLATGVIGFKLVEIERP